MVDVGFLSVSFDDLIEGNAQQESLLVSCVFSSYSVAGLLQLVIFCLYERLSPVQNRVHELPQLFRL
jgi:hypothetical protein